MAIQDPLTGLIIGCCFRVANELGPGFLEKVHENALVHELRKAKVKVIQQQGIGVFHDGIRVGNHEADSSSSFSHDPCLGVNTNSKRLGRVLGLRFFRYVSRMVVQPNENSGLRPRPGRSSSEARAPISFMVRGSF